MINNVLKKYNLLFIVCHPDDEALWVGGLIFEFSKINLFNVYVICLSGANSGSLRIKEFYHAKSLGKYFNGIILGDKLGPADIPLLEIAPVVKDGLKKLKLKQNNIDLLITHSPFGDEHQNPHHIQAYKELLRWTKNNQVPFGFFSCIPIPFFNLEPQLKNMKRNNTLQLLNFAKCFYRASFLQRPMHNNSLSFLECPSYYLQFLVDGIAKKKIIASYKSIGINSLDKNYATFSNNCESLYIFNDKGLKPFLYLFSQMEVPGSEDLFVNFYTLYNKSWLYFKNRLSIILKYAMHPKAKNQN